MSKDNSRNSKHKLGEYKPIFTSSPITEMKDAYLRVVRQYCVHCHRVTPHKFNKCQWHVEENIDD